MKTEDCEIKPDVFNNPWLVQSFDEFLFYCCPECNYKCQVHEEFNSHAVTAHPLVRNFFFLHECSLFRNERFMLNEMI